MRKLKLQVQMSVDGFIAGPNGEMDWMTWDWDEKLLKYVQVLTAPVDCIVLGRVLAQGFIPHWTDAASKTKREDDIFTHIMAETPKVVFTKTLETNEWANTVLAKGNLVKEIKALKKQAGKDIIAYGGGAFVSELIKHNLIDEYHLFINPTAIGNGMTIFKGLDKTHNLQLVKASAFKCGIVVLKYKRKKVVKVIAAA
jgi:dihydrofolate reductase